MQVRCHSRLSSQSQPFGSVISKQLISVDVLYYRVVIKKEPGPAPLPTLSRVFEGREGKG